MEMKPESRQAHCTLRGNLSVPFMVRELLPPDIQFFKQCLSFAIIYILKDFQAVINDFFKKKR